MAIAVALTPTNHALKNTLYLVYKTNKISPDTSDIKGTSLGLQDITVHLQKHVSVSNYSEEVTFKNSYIYILEELTFRKIYRINISILYII